MSYNIHCLLTQTNRSPCDDHVGTSYQQWLTSVEVRGQGSQERIPPPPPPTSSSSMMKLPVAPNHLSQCLRGLAYTCSIILPCFPACPFQTLLTNHPAGHVLAALERLAAERESEIRSLCSGDGLKEEELSRWGASVPIARSRHSGRQMGWS